MYCDLSSHVVTVFMLIPTVASIPFFSVCAVLLYNIGYNKIIWWDVWKKVSNSVQSAVFGSCSAVKNLILWGGFLFLN